MSTRKSFIPLDVAQRALERFERHPGSSCHFSLNPVNGQGHVLVQWTINTSGAKTTTTVARAAWVAAAGHQAPDGWFVVHTCREVSCVNPKHLRLQKAARKTTSSPPVARTAPSGTPRHPSPSQVASGPHTASGQVA